VRKNTELVSKDAALVNENTVMAFTIAKLQSSVENRYTDQQPLLEPMDIVDQPSDGVHPAPSVHMLQLSLSLLILLKRCEESIAFA